MREIKHTYKQQGYVKNKAEGHPHADVRGYVMEHRLVVEKAMGKYLPKHAVIHHKNGVRHDNRLENLEYIPEQARHAKMHDTGKRNPNGQFVAIDPKFAEIKFRLLNKNTGLTDVYTLAKLISTTFRNSQFDFRGRFTGLKDKNGKEIYEGDIIAVPHEFGARMDKREVYYDRCAFYGKSEEDNGFLCDHLVNYWDTVEVIGNIFQDSHLLKMK